MTSTNSTPCVTATAPRSTEVRVSSDFFVRTRSYMHEIRSHTKENEALREHRAMKCAKVRDNLFLFSFDLLHRPGVTKFYSKLCRNYCRIKVGSPSQKNHHFVGGSIDDTRV